MGSEGVAGSESVTVLTKCRTKRLDALLSSGPISDASLSTLRNKGGS